MKKSVSFFNAVFLGFGIVISLLILASALFSQPFNVAPNETPLLMDAFYRLGATMIAVLALLFSMRKLRQLNKNKLLFIILGILLVQAVFIFKFQRPVSTDTGYVFDQAEQLANGNFHWLKYFQIYPNNVMISLFWALIYKVFNLLGITNHYLGAVVVQTLLYDLSLGFAVQQSHKIPKFNTKWFLVLGLAYFPMWLFNLFIYNDIVGVAVIYITLGLWIKFIYAQSTAQRWWALAGASLCLAFGMLVRQNLLIIGIALILALVFTVKQPWFKKLGMLSLILVVFGAVNLAGQAVEHQTNFKTTEQIKMPTVSWINMGLNPGTSGETNVEDTWGWYGLKEPKRTEELKNSIQFRLDFMSKRALLDHFWHKIRYTFARGLTLMDFSNVISVQKNLNIISASYVMAQLTQPIYSALIILALIALWQAFKIHDERKSIIIFSALSIVGVFLFHVLLWETRDRYGIVIWPFLFMLSGFVDVEGKSFAWKNQPKILLSLGAIGMLLLMFGAITNRPILGERQIINQPTLSHTYEDYTFSRPIKLKANSEYEFKFKVYNFSNRLNAKIRDAALTPEEADKVHIKIYAKKKLVADLPVQATNRYPVKLHPGTYKMQVVNQNQHDIADSRMFIYTTKKIAWPDDAKVKRNQKLDNSIEPTFTLEHQAKQTLVDDPKYCLIFGVYMILGIINFYLIGRPWQRRS